MASPIKPTEVSTLSTETKQHTKYRIHIHQQLAHKHFVFIVKSEVLHQS